MFDSGLIKAPWTVWTLTNPFVLTVQAMHVDKIPRYNAEMESRHMIQTAL